MIGVRAMQALLRLLSPVQRASESRALIRELFESSDLYHPLAWTSAEAYEFLKETPLYDQCGVIARLPDWWKKRTRPRVSVTIGSTKQSRLDADALKEEFQSSGMAALPSALRGIEIRKALFLPRAAAP